MAVMIIFVSLSLSFSLLQLYISIMVCVCVCVCSAGGILYYGCKIFVKEIIVITSFRNVSRLYRPI